MKITNSNTTFTGYSNVIAHMEKDKAEQHFTLFVTAKLNDIGEKDLTKFLKLKKEINAKTPEAFKDIQTDVITFTYNYSKPTNIEIFSIDNFSLLDGQGLKEYRRYCLAKMETYIQYKQAIGPYMKAYTLLASLTKRISNSNNEKINTEDIESMAKHIHNVMNKRFLDENRANNFVAKLLFSTREPVQEISGKFNKAIANTMNIFLN